MQMLHRKWTILVVLVLLAATVPLFAGPLDWLFGRSKKVEAVIMVKPTHEEWQAKKKAKNQNKDDYQKKRAAYLANPTPGTLNAMLTARTKYQDSAKDSRAYRESLKKNH